MKTIEVVAAVIVHDGKVFAAQRGYGDQKDGWEFPGGKMETGETPEAALVREIREELAVTVTPVKLLTTVEYEIPPHDALFSFVPHRGRTSAFGTRSREVAHERRTRYGGVAACGRGGGRSPEAGTLLRLATGQFDGFRSLKTLSVSSFR